MMPPRHRFARPLLWLLCFFVVTCGGSPSPQVATIQEVGLPGGPTPGGSDSVGLEAAPTPRTPITEMLPADGLPSTEVGSLAGKFEVTDDGVARYTVSLPLPVGHASVQPSVALVYASNAGNGLLGVGVNLTGFSSIGRCSLIPAVDGVRQSVRLDITDALCLDGQRLVLISGVHLADGAVYRTERDTMVRVRQSGWGDDATFFADFPDGRKFSYGTTSDSVVWTAGVTAAWSVARVDDPFGNHVTFTYASELDDTVAAGSPAASSTVDHRPESISMWGSVRHSPREAITFHYVDRDDRYEQHMAGGIRRTSSILSEVRLHDPDGQHYRSYAFEYESSSTTRKSRLQSARMCEALADGELGACMPATTFAWTDSSSPEYAAAPDEMLAFNGEPWPNQWVGDRSLPVVPMNVNGDAYDDFVFLSADTETWHIWFGGESGVQLDTGLESPTFSAIGVYRVDMNGDGRDDMLVSDAYIDDDLQETGTYGDYFRIFLGRGGTEGFDEHVIDLDVGGTHAHGIEAPLMFSTAPYSAQPMMAAADFDGDGLTDLAICHPMHPEDVVSPGDAGSVSAWFLYHNDGAGGWERENTISYQHCSADDFIVVDYDGDGAQNLLLVRHPDGAWPSMVDGSYEALAKTSYGTWANEPTGLPRDLSQRLLLDSTGGAAVLGGGNGQDRVIDLNGDGLSDIVRFVLEEGDTVADLASGGWGNGEGRLIAWLNTGHGFREWGTIYPDNGATVNYTTSRQASVLDLEGDGGGEILMPEPGEWIAVGLTPMPAGQEVYGAKQVPTGIPYGLVGPGFESRIIAPFDWNLDGLHDALTDISVDDATEVYAFTRQGQRPDLMVEIIDGYGHRIGVEYAPMTDPAVYTTDTTACVHPVTCDYDARPLVRYETHDLGINAQGTSEQIAHSYVDGRTHRGGRGWLGFAQHSFVPIDDNVSRVLTRVYLDNQTFNSDIDAYPFAGLRSRVIRESQVVDGRRRVTDERNTYRVRLPPERKTWFQIRDSSKVSEYDFVDADTCLPGECSVDLAFLQTLTPTRQTTSTFEYDSFGNTTLVAVTGAAGGQSRVERRYDNDTTLWYLGRSTERKERSTVGGVTATRTSTFRYDRPTGTLLESTVEPRHALYELKTTLVRDPFGNVEDTTAEDSATDTIRATHVEYDALGVFPSETTNAEGHVSEHVYSYRHGGLRRNADPNGVVDDLTYDTFGRLIRRERRDGVGGEFEGRIETYAYERRVLGDWTVPSTLRTTFNAPGHGYLVTDLDTRGRWVRRQWYEANELAVEQRQTYSEDGLPSETELPTAVGIASPGATVRAYDPFGRLRSETRPDGSSTVVAFPTAFERRVVDEGDFVTTYIEDREGRVIRSEDDAGTPTCYGYGPFGLMTVMKRGCTATRSLWTEMAYDAYGRRTGLTDPSLGSRTQTYNAFGELVSVRDTNGVPVQFRYDGLGRRVERTDQTGSTTWNWDVVGGTGRYGTLHDDASPDGVVNQYEYDAFGRLIERRTSIGAASFEFAFGHDTFGREAYVEMPPSFGDDVLIAREFDEWGHLVSVWNYYDQVEYWRLDEVHPSGMPEEEVFGNGLTTNRGYDPLSLQPQWITTSPDDGDDVQYLVYLFDPDGTLQFRGDAVLDQTEDFTYDGHRQLETVEVDSGLDNDVYDYDYDNFGNFTFRTGVGSYVYDPSHPDRLQSVGGEAVTYDANGNIEAIGDDLAIEYTPFDVPSEVTSDGETSTFRYDADGLRARRFDGVDGSVTLYAGDYQRRTIGLSLASEHRYQIRAGGRVVAELVRESDEVIGGGGPGDPPSYETRLHYLHDDHLGSVDVVTDQDGDVLQRMSFDSFGLRRDEVWTSSSSPDPAVTTAAGFTGHLGTNDGGLVPMPRRWYSPALGRFLSADPLVTRPFEPVGTNRYVYAWNQPLSLVDPTGMAPGDDCMNDCVYRRVHVPKPAEGTFWSVETFREAQRVYNHAVSEISREVGRSDGFADAVWNAAPVAGHWAMAGASRAMDHFNNFYSGVGDGVIPGLSYVREWINPDVTNYESELYSNGYVTGVATGLALSAATGLGASKAMVDAAAQTGKAAAAASALAQGGRVAGVGTTTASRSSGTALARQLGVAGEVSAGIVKNTERIASATGTAAYRIPDVLDHGAKIIGEVKNVGKLSYTNQLRDFVAYASQNQYTFVLQIRRSTELSAPLQQAIAEGKIVLGPFL